MEGNLVIVEIKPANAETMALTGDLKKLNAFCTQAGYKMGVLLMFGDHEDEKRIRNRCEKALSRLDTTIDRISILWQDAPRRTARQIFTGKGAA